VIVFFLHRKVTQGSVKSPGEALLSGITSINPAGQIIRYSEPTLRWQSWTRKSTAQVRLVIIILPNGVGDAGDKLSAFLSVFITGSAFASPCGRVAYAQLVLPQRGKLE